MRAIGCDGSIGKLVFEAERDEIPGNEHTGGWQRVVHDSDWLAQRIAVYDSRSEIIGMLIKC